MVSRRSNAPERRLPCKGKFGCLYGPAGRQDGHIVENGRPPNSLDMRLRMGPSKVLMAGRIRIDECVMRVFFQLPDDGLHPTGGCGRVARINTVEGLMKNDVHYI